jgi:hypothetical protein
VRFSCAFTVLINTGGFDDELAAIEEHELGSANTHNLTIVDFEYYDKPSNG